MSLFTARLYACLAFSCLISLGGCATNSIKPQSLNLASIKTPKFSAPKFSAPKLKVADLKLPQIKLPELQVPELKVPQLQAPNLGSKFAERSATKKPTTFRLVGTGKDGKQLSGQTLGDPNALNAPSKSASVLPDSPGLMTPSQLTLDNVAKETPVAPEANRPAPTKSSATDTMALIDKADESIQGAFAEAKSMPLSDQSGLSTATQSINHTLQPRDAGSQPDQFRDISESEMLRIALTRSPILRSLGIRILDNPQAATTIYDVAIDESDPFFGPQAALAEFDSVLSASLNSQNNDRVFNNATLGGQVQELTQDLVNLNAGWQRRTTTGATWELNSLTGYDNNNRQGNRFRNYWETQLEAGVRQPLLQGAGRQFNRIAGPNARPGFNFSNGIVIAQMNNQISQADFEISLRSYVRDLYSAYWDLVRQYNAYQSVLQSKELSYQTWQTVLAKNKADLEGGEANKEAQARAKYYNYRREVQNALGGETGLYVAERRLRQLIGMPAIDGQLLRPTDEPVTARYVFDFDHLVARAMTGRTELRRQNTRVRQQQLRLVAAKNFLLPQMDLIGRYRLRGFGDDLTGGGERFSSAYDDFASLDHQEWEFGLEMGVTAGRRQAHAAVRNAKLQLSRESTILCEQQRMVRHEMSEAFAEVSSSYFTMESSAEQVAASRERLQATEALFEADKIQIEFLLDAQEELLRAELQLAADQARYSLALVEINNTSGTLLRDIGVNIAQTHCGTRVQYLPSQMTPASTDQRLPVASEFLADPTTIDSTPSQPKAPEPESLPTPPKDKPFGAPREELPAPKLQPAPKAKLLDELIKAPSPESPLQNFFRNPSNLFKPSEIPEVAKAKGGSPKQANVPSRSVSYSNRSTTKAESKPQSTMDKSLLEAKSDSTSASGRVIAKPSYKPSMKSPEPWSQKATKTKSRSRFHLPNLFRAVPTSVRTP